MRIVYAGSPDISAVPLEFLLKEKKHEVCAVLTNPPSMQGRSKELIPTPVALAAMKYNESCSPGKAIPVLTPLKLDSSVRESISSLNPDILVCFAYGKLFGPKFLALFPKGGINLHPSLLPKYRGCAPVPAAILNRDSVTGITVQRLAQEMDSGDILLQNTITLDGRETAQTLLEKAAGMGGEMLSRVLTQIGEGTEKAVKQEHDSACYCTILCKNDGCIDWNQSAPDIDARIRAFTPWPGAFTTVQKTVLRIHEAFIYDKTDIPESEGKPNGTILAVDKTKGILVKTGDGILVLTNLQWQAKKAMHWKDFINGTKNFIGLQCE